MGPAGKFLEGDAVLLSLVALALNNTVDFSKAKLRDPFWRRRLEVLLRGLHWQRTQEEAKRQDQLLHIMAITLAANTPAGALDLEKVWEQLEFSSKCTQHVACPWLPSPKKVDRNKTLADMWRQTYGDPNDPEVQKRIQNTVKALLATPAKDDNANKLKRKGSRR